MSYLPGSLYSYQTVTSTPTPQVVANRVIYVCSGTSTLNFILPATSIAGMTFKIVANTCLWNLFQNATQTISFESQTTTPGTSGMLSATKLKDRVEVECLLANTQYNVCDCLGNLTVT